MKRFTCDRVIHFPLILGGAMAPSAVSSVSNLRDLEFMPRRVLVHISIMETQQVSTNGEFHTGLHIAGKTGDQYIEAM